MNNMMMDRNDSTAESLILIDFDNTQYGYRYTKLFKIWTSNNHHRCMPLNRYLSIEFHHRNIKIILFRAFDWAYHLGYVSKIKYGWNHEQIEIDGKYFLSDEDINEWLEIYKDNVDAPDVTLEQLWLEFNLHMPYVALGMS